MHHVALVANVVVVLLPLRLLQRLVLVVLVLLQRLLGPVQLRHAQRRAAPSGGRRAPGLA